MQNTNEWTIAFFFWPALLLFFCWSVSFYLLMSPSISSLWLDRTGSTQSCWCVAENNRAWINMEWWCICAHYTGQTLPYGWRRQQAKPPDPSEWLHGVSICRKILPTICHNSSDQYEDPLYCKRQCSSTATMGRTSQWFTCKAFFGTVEIKLSWIMWTLIKNVVLLSSIKDVSKVCCCDASWLPGCCWPCC